MKGICRRVRGQLGVAVAVAAGALLAGSAAGADATWNTNASGDWTDASKWSTNPDVPGAVGTTDNPDAVTIAPAVGGKAITLDAGRNLASIDFNANSSIVTLSGGSLVLTGGGSIQTSGAGAGAGAIVASAITLAGDYTFTSGSSTASRLLKITNTVAGSAGSGSTSVLTLNGTNTDITNAVSGAISDGENGGKLAVVKDGTGAWALSVANSFSGGVTLRDGTLVMLNAGALGSGGVTLDGGTLRASSGYTIANAIELAGSVSYGSNNTFTFDGSFALGNAAGTSRTIDVSGGTSSMVVINGAIANGATATQIRKTGTGTLSLTNAANSFSSLVVEGGLVTAAAAGNANFATPTAMDARFGSGTITLNGGGLRVTLGTASTTYAQVANAIDLAGDGSLNISNGARQFVLYSGVISGGGRLRLGSSQEGSQDPSGIVLQNTNTYSGGTELNSTGFGTSSRAVVVADAVNALGGGIGGVGGVVSFIDTNAAAAPLAPHTYLSLKADQNVAGLVSNRGKTWVTGFSATTLATLTITSTAGGAGDGSVFVGNLGAGATPSAAGVSGLPAAGNNLRLVKAGTGTQVLAGMNTYSGGTVIDGGTLVVNGGATAAPAGRTGDLVHWNTANAPANGSVVSNIDTTGLSVGQFVYGTGTTIAPSIVSIGSNFLVLSGASPKNLGAAAIGVSLTFSPLTASAAVSGISVASTGLVSSTSLTLSGTAGLTVGQFISANRVGAPTQITAINGNVVNLSLSTDSANQVAAGSAVTVWGTSGTGSGSVVVNNTGRLAGVGGIVGDVIVNSGGAIAPGATDGSSAGTLRIGGLTLASGATYQAELDFAGESTTGPADLLAVSGGVTLGGATLALSLLNTDGLATKTFVLLTNDGTDAIVGAFTVTPPVGGLINYSIAYNYNADGGAVGNDVAISFTSVPEPGAITLGGLALAGGLLRRRRRR